MDKLLTSMKMSAIHNLKIQCCENEQREGIILPPQIMKSADLQCYQQVIITRISGDSFCNRIRSFVIEGEEGCCVTACGSISKFLKVGDLTCIIGETSATNEDIENFNKDRWPIFDVGFNAETNVDNTEFFIELQYASKKYITSDKEVLETAANSRNGLARTILASLIIGMKINKTHPDCLHGSAEIPKSVLHKANVKQYKSVCVYNSSIGGEADTYAVEMPEGIVMTTGAMASFASIGNYVNIAAFVISDKVLNPTICITDGIEVVDETIKIRKKI